MDAAEIAQRDKLRPEFDRIVSTMYKRIFGLAFRLSTNKAVAQDITQATFERAWRFYPQFDHERQIDSGSANHVRWLLTICVSIFNSDYRYNQVRKKYEGTVQKMYEWQELATADQLENEITLSQALDIIATMKPRERAILEMWLLGWEFHEIASELDIPDGTAKSSFTRSRTKLYAMMNTNPEKVEHARLLKNADLQGWRARKRAKRLRESDDEPANHGMAKRTARAA